MNGIHEVTGSIPVWSTISTWLFPTAAAASGSMGGRGDRRGARRVSAFLMGALGSSFDAKRWLPRQRNDEAVRGERDDDREDGE